MAEPETTPSDTPATHQRRARYRGTHPRRFEEKYKEHNAERYADEVRKIIARGKTPAGSHRPICVPEIMEVLAPQAGETAVDATLGYGGHALELARALLPGGRLIGLDVDGVELGRAEARLCAAGIPAGALTVRRSNFAGLPQVLAAAGVAGADMVLADLGVSSMQLDDPARGFSFKFDGPLDMRMNPARGRPAWEFMAGLNAREWAALLSANADEPHAVLIAQAICEAQRSSPITRTAELARAVREAVSADPRARAEADAAVRRTFQALRIAVNDEFGALEMFLRNLPGCLKPGGRAAILTFHSGEDRRVKKAFRTGERAGVYARIAGEVIRASAAEIRANPRAASAKLRWAVRG
jgi:16S rRNA (cytosine1402-N4)-methyltransferase